MDYFEEYYYSKPIVGKKLQAVLDKLLNEKKDDSRYCYNTKRAHFYIDFIERFVKGTKSPYYGKPTKLLLWQKAFIEVLYSFQMADSGVERFQRSLLVIARKNGKSTLSAALGFCELMLGDGGKDIVCSSNNDAQANILYDTIETTRHLFDKSDKRSRKTISYIENKKTHSRVSKLNQNSQNKDGRNIDFAIVDELQEMRDNAIIKAIEQSQSVKINPKLIMITTEGFINGGALDELITYADKVIAGEVDDERFLPWLYMQDSENEVWQNPESWYKSNPSLDVIKKRDYLEQQLTQAQVSKSERVFVMCKDFNLKQSSSEAWLLPNDYTYPQKKIELEDMRGIVCVAGVDLSETTDLTAVQILFTCPNDSNKYVFSHYFIPEIKLTESPDYASGARYRDWIEQGYMTVLEGTDINTQDIADYIIGLCRDYGIKLYRVGYDQRFAKPFTDRLEDCGIETEVVYQNANTMSAPMRSCEADFKAHNIHFGNHPITEWTISNTCAYVNGLGQTMAVKIANQSQRRIDGLVALVIAYAIYQRQRGEYALYSKENKI